MCAAHLVPADLWIQAASAGEAFLAANIVRHLSPARPVRVLLTTTTVQGMQILKAEQTKKNSHPDVSVSLEWFPFDTPAVAKAAVKAVHPKVMVLLETELWPALLHFLKQNRTQILVVNGRMSHGSGRRYRWTRKLWSRISPHQVLAISARDAARYKQVFQQTKISVMPNIKFDIFAPEPGKTESHETGTGSLADIFPCPLPVSILASIRRQEENQALRMIHHILDNFPKQVVAVFPRHMHRITSWKRALAKTGHPFYLRSQMTTPLSCPGIILWDRFGEMHTAFGHAAAVFMGGSLASLGGQNFMEPLLQGAPVVTGPFWDDFFWVGTGVFDTGLVEKKTDWQTAADAMVRHLEHPGDRSKRRQKAIDYVTARAGGTDLACKAILDALSNA
ncbi:MAG: 3-deoxy-D-manno-octulosonic acid transferase [Desulfobacteraceae bacterium]|nr:3-deoxy-D-manno-octulosonic acid transferase [Desulfobacteraceae bacterium]